MERRDRLIEALARLNYIDSLDDPALKADLLENWVEKNLSSSDILEDKDLDANQLTKLSELLYKNINFLKEHRQNIKTQLDSHSKIKEFLK